jgi:hypothetical protein
VSSQVVSAVIEVASTNATILGPPDVATRFNGTKDDPFDRGGRA